MTSTDELRKMLDERGVEYEAYMDVKNRCITKWRTYHGAFVFFAVEKEGKLFVETASDTEHSAICTPEQAIAATLGTPISADLRTALDFMRIWITDDAHLGESAISYEFEKAEGLRKLDAIEQAIAATLGEKPRDRTEEWLLNACDQAAQDYVAQLERERDELKAFSGRLKTAAHDKLGVTLFGVDYVTEDFMLHVRDTLTAERDEWKAKAEQAERAMNAAAGKWARADDENRELRKMLLLDDGTVEEYTERADPLTALAYQKQLAEEWRDRCHNAEALCDKLEAERDELSDKIGEITDEGSELMKKQPYTFDVHDVPESLRTVGRYIDELTAERDQWREAAGNAHDMWEKAVTERDELQRELDIASAKLAGKPECEICDRATLLVEIEKLRDERDEWKTKCETREVAYKQADAERKRYSEQIDELRAERDALASDLDDAMRRLAPKAKDGEPIAIGETLYGEDCKAWEVEGFDFSKAPYTVVGVHREAGCGKQKRELKPKWLTHEEPDSWVRIIEDAIRGDGGSYGCLQERFEATVPGLVERCGKLANRRVTT